MEKIVIERNVCDVLSKSLPYTYRFHQQIEIADFKSWYTNNKEEIEGILTMVGAILFKGINICDVDSFEEAINPIADKFIDYKDGFSPRKKLSANTYTSTEYDADFFITLHNELSFSSVWPSKLFFCCIVPSATGGETAIADGRSILKEINKELLAELEYKGVKYIRNLHGGDGPGPSWQQTYDTHDKAVVERFCRERDIKLEWKSNGGLKIVQYRPATIAHPLTRERVWFNQIDQFHPSHFENEIYETLMMMYDNEEELPMFGEFGDGSKIGEDKIMEIKRAVDKCMILNPWEKGDLLMIDNVMVCHGRMPYTGNRRVLVSMTR